MEGKYMRALVPANSSFTAPKMESWGTEKNNDYSSSYNKNYSGSGYGRGYARRSGGGGGGGSKSIYSHAPSLNAPTAATPRDSSLRESNYDRFYPSYKVAGSRKARSYNA